MPAPIVIRGPLDRLRYTLLFEISLIGMMAPLLALLLEHAVLELGLLAVVLSGMAMLQSAIYNYLYDRVDVHYGRIPTERSWKGRIMHAVGFELLLTSTSLPLIVWWLEMGWIDALLMDIGLMVGVVFYTLLYTWIYDRLFPLRQPGEHCHH